MTTAAALAENRKTFILGFIGVGWIGRNRMKVLLNGMLAEAAIISEPSPENALEALKLAPAARLTGNPEAVYTHPEVDGVVIATPSALHASQTLEALKAGKSVFCQKPLGRNAREVRELVSASRNADKLLAVDLSYRFIKAFEAVRHTVVSGEIGKVYAVKLVFHNAYGPDKPWFYDISKSGGGCVMDLGVHLIDMALHCLGFPQVTEINSCLYSKGQKLETNEAKVEDFAQVSMLTSEGTAIALECSWHVSAGQDAVIEAVFYGTEGGVAFKNVNGSFYNFMAEKYKGTYRETLMAEPDDWGGRAGLQWAGEVMDGKGFDPVTAQEFIATAEIIDRIYGRPS